MLGTPIKFVDETLPMPTKAPTVGQHTEQVLRDVLGWDDEQIAAARDARRVRRQDLARQQAGHPSSAGFSARTPVMYFSPRPKRRRRGTAPCNTMSRIARLGAFVELRATAVGQLEVVDRPASRRS